MSGGKTIVVNQFLFCFEHGNETCYLCSRDYRQHNNASGGMRIYLSKKLGYDFETIYGFDLEQRPPINIYAFGVTKSVHYRGPRASGSCPDHGKTDCMRCFDWVRLVGSEATRDNFDGVRARRLQKKLYAVALGSTV